jgi:transglutaminase-like putative cysteine protease
VRAETAPELTVKIPVRDEALRPYLLPGDLAQSDDAAIRARARAILAGQTDAWLAARRLSQWVYQRMKKVESEPQPVSATEILRTMKGDCTEHAILLAALCQAVGLPVKIVAGLAYADGAFHYHAWNEVYVGRWLEIDPTWGEDLADAGHLQIAAAALDSTSMARLSLATGRTMGSLDLAVLDFTAKR